MVGSGVAGLTAAYVASSDEAVSVTLYEADDRLGGHADTHDVAGPDGVLAIDTGFIVHNERTYPTLLRIFAELGVATQDSEMSMSTRDDAHGPGVGRRARGRRPVPHRAEPGPTGVPPDAHRDPALPPRRPPPPGGGAATTPRCAGSSTPTASRRTSPGTSWSPSWPRSGRATRTSPWTTRPATCSASSTTTACSASSGRPSGRRWSEARGRTSSGSARGSTTSASARP